VRAKEAGAREHAELDAGVIYEAAGRRRSPRRRRLYSWVREGETVDTHDADLSFSLQVRAVLVARRVTHPIAQFLRLETTGQELVRHLYQPLAQVQRWRGGASRHSAVGRFAEGAGGRKSGFRKERSIILCLF